MIIDNAIKGNCVSLRTVTLEDAEYTYSIRSGGERTRFIHMLNGGIDQQKKWIQSQIDSQDSYFFIVIDIKGRPIGTYAIYEINLDLKTAIVGRALLNGNPIQNLEAIYLVHEFAFYFLEMEKIYTDVFEENVAAVGVNKQVGGMVTDRNFNEEFQLYNLRFEITRDNYNKKRMGIKRLVQRFSNR